MAILFDNNPINSNNSNHKILYNINEHYNFYIYRIEVNGTDINFPLVSKLNNERPNKHLDNILVLSNQYNVIKTKLLISLSSENHQYIDNVDNNDTVAYLYSILNKNTHRITKIELMDDCELIIEISFIRPYLIKLKEIIN